MGVTCQILICKTREGVYKPGQAIKGIVKYAVDEPTEYEKVTLSFIGKAKCRWSERHNNRTTTYYIGKERTVDQYINLLNVREEETAMLSGCYEYPFEFILPDNIPSSYKDTNATINYRVQLKFERPSFFSFDKVFTTELPVHGFVTPESEGPVVFGLEKTLFAPFTPDLPVIRLRATIEKSCLKPGENVQLKYEIQNNTGVKVTAVKTELYCYTTYKADRERSKSISDEIDACEVETYLIDGEKSQMLTCTLQTLPELYSIQNTKVMKKEYWVRVTLILPMPHFNVSVEMPVLLGEGKEERGLHVASLGHDGDQPPSYWEAVCVEKNKKLK